MSSEDVDVVWSHYLQIRAIRRPRARINVLSDSDRKLIKKRLAEKLTVDSLCLAVDGLFDSAFHIEKNFLALNYALKESNLEKFITEGERARRGVKLPAANAPPLREADPRQPLVAALAPGSGPEANGVQGDPGEAQLYPEFDWTALSRRKESKPS